MCVGQVGMHGPLDDIEMNQIELGKKQHSL